MFKVAALALLGAAALPARAAAQPRGGDADGDDDGTPWVAVFFDNATQQALAADFLVEGVPSDAELFCEHCTLEYGPDAAAWRHWETQMDAPAPVALLAYGHDEHSQALLVNAGEQVSTNANPHVTVADEAEDPYTAVYTEVLWERLLAAAGADVALDASGKPSAVSLPGGAGEWSGAVPERVDGNVTYAATEGYIRLLSPPGGIVGRVCVSYAWDRETTTCDFF